MEFDVKFGCNHPESAQRLWLEVCCLLLSSVPQAAFCSHLPKAVTSLQQTLKHCSRAQLSSSLLHLMPTYYVCPLALQGCGPGLSCAAACATPCLGDTNGCRGTAGRGTRVGRLSHPHRPCPHGPGKRMGHGCSPVEVLRCALAPHCTGVQSKR